VAALDSGVPAFGGPNGIGPLPKADAGLGAAGEAGLPCAPGVSVAGAPGLAWPNVPAGRFGGGRVGAEKGIPGGCGGLGLEASPPRGGNDFFRSPASFFWPLPCGSGSGATTCGRPCSSLAPAGWRFRPSNGLQISSGTVICFWTRRRLMSAGLIRARISLRGSGTGVASSSESCWNTCGAALQSSA